jgi:5-methylcytosine-specific restriction protein B
MNVADRSLALVDMAFRRRFAFINLEPNLNKTWKDYVVNKLHMDSSVANYIQSEIVNLNSQIASDSRLGKDFQVGHSFFTPNESLKTKDSKKWFREVVESEIAPLLQEYWFDSLEEADKAIEKLLANL